MTFNIQRFSTHDGPGIRTVVFFKGCPLRCTWCENPESQSPYPELLYDERLCIGCLDCVRAAGAGEVTVKELIDSAGSPAPRPVFHRERIRDPERLRGVCPTRALSVVGEAMGVEEILREIEKDRPFYGTDGGATLSGGEPFSQPDLVRELMRLLAERKVGVAVETSLQVPWRAIEPVLSMEPIFLADLKHVRPAGYRAATGGNLALVQANFRRLEAAGARVIVRIPVVPGLNDDPEDMGEILHYVSTLANVRELHLLPYHTLGKGKYESLGRNYPMGEAPALAPERIEPYARAAENLGFRVRIGG